MTARHRVHPDAAGFALCESAHVTRTVLVVDDHAGFRAIARALVEAGGMTVVGEAASGAEALALCGASDPDLVLLDIQLPDIDGFEVRERILRSARPPAVLLTSTRKARAYGGRLTDPVPIPFVAKDDLSVAALTDLLDAR